MNPENRILIEAHRVGMVLFAIAAGLTAMHVVSVVAWYTDSLPIDNWLYISFFDLDEEESLGTWFSALILLLAGQLLLLQARYVRWSAQRWGKWWFLLSLGFHLLSLDEVAGFHEFVNTVVEGTHWTTFGAGIVLLVGIAYLPFLWSLPKKTRWLFIIAGAIYVGGAVGVERATIWYEVNDQLDTLSYNLWNGVEEFMEMTGVILFIYALLAHIADTPPRNRLQLQFSP